MTGSSITPAPGGPLAPAAEVTNLGAAMMPAYGAGPQLSPVARFFGALRRFKWLVLGVFALGATGSVLYTRWMPDRYRVGVTLSLYDRGENAINAPQMLSSRQWEELLRTDAVLEPVVIARKLYIRGPRTQGFSQPPLEGPWGPYAGAFDSFEWGPRTRAGRYRFEVSGNGRSWTLTNQQTGQVDRGNIGQNVGTAFGFLWAPDLPSLSGQTLEFDVLTPNEVARALYSQLNTEMQPMGARFMRIFLEGQSSEGIARTLNTVADQFVQTAAEIKRSNLSAEATVLDTQLVAARERLDRAQAQLETFKVRAITQPNTGVPVTAGLQQTQPAVLTDYFGLRYAVDSLRRERAELETAMSQATGGAVTVDRLRSIGVVANAGEIQQVLNELSQAETLRRNLLLRYFPEHDSVVAIDGRIRELRTQTLPEYVNAILTRLEREQQQLESRIQVATRDLEGIPQRTIEEDALNRELQVADQQYRDIYHRSQLSRLQEASSLPDVGVLDRAVPPVEPQRNKANFILIAGILGSLGLALALAFLLDLTDRRFRYSNQVTTELGLSILGAIPEIRRAKGGTAAAEEASQVIEAFRSIRLNMMHVVGNGQVCFTVSSPMPGDGKSLVSSNLALSFAEAGMRTLLVDGDTRRGELHRMFGRDRRPGLLDHLADGVPLDQILGPTSHPRLTLITGGSRHRNGPELLGSVRMRELLGQLRERFDVVIFDSPPFGAGIDPFVLGTLTQNLLMVVRVGETEREFTEAKLQIIDQLPVRVVGAVLNDVRTTMREYKYYSYSYGYGATDEDETTTPVAIPSGEVRGES
jgi:capsular exopolysaccharide synthesis family protein